jgi:8-oxo-dGTP pyrophosphatase MutT (NUDIX family)
MAVEVALGMLQRERRWQMQLRDEIPTIVAPGCWGLFGRHLDPGETPEQALRRELLEEIRLSTRVVSIFPNDTEIIRLVGALLLEQQEEWQLDGSRVFSELSMAKLDSTTDPGQDQLSSALSVPA